MAYTRVYPTRINWENEPSINTPINEVNLNKTDYALYQMDGTLANWDTTKANQSDLLLSVKSVDYDTETGVFVFTWQNGTTKTIDLNIEKIPISFSMSPAGVITMTTEDGSTYTADVGELIKTYTFTDSSVIDFTVTTDSDGNKTVTADIVDGSITGTKLQPNYLADCQSAKTDAESAEVNAKDSAEDSEAWANGTRNGVPVPSTDPTYHNNSKYWSEQSNPTSLVGLTDTDINNPTNGQTLIYNSTNQKWENQNGGSASLAGLSDVDLTAPADGQVLTYDSTNQEWVNADIGASGGSNITVTTTEATLYGQNVTISDGVTTLTETFSPSGVALFEGVTMTGQLTIASGAFSTTVNVPYFGNYNPVLSGFTATITVTFPADSTCTCTKSGETQTAYVSPHTFYVHSVGTYTITATDGTHTKSDTVIITTDGQSESVTLTYVPDGSTVLPTDNIQIWLNCADIYDKNYTTLAEVLADSTTLAALIADNNAVDYMVRSKSWATQVTVPKMTSDTTPSGVASASSIYSAQSTTKYAYLAFDGNVDRTNMWNTAENQSSAWLQYEFPSAVVIDSFSMITEYTSRGLMVKQFEILGSNDGFVNDSHTLYTSEVFANQTGGPAAYTKTGNLTSTGAYKYYRFNVLSTYDTSGYIGLYELQLYGENGITEDATAMTYIGLNNYCANTLLADNDWLNAICNSTYFESVLNAKVPVMTDNTHPSGVAFGSSVNSGNDFYMAFSENPSSAWLPASGATNNRIGYKFTAPNKCKLVTLQVAGSGNDASGSDVTAIIQGRMTDSDEWNDLKSFTIFKAYPNTQTYSVIIDGNFAENIQYCLFAADVLYRGTSPYTIKQIALLQFYGRIDV